MKWLIVEDALRDRRGHWLEYVSTFVRGLRALGDEVVVLGDREAEGFILEQTGALPVLPESIWHRMGDGAGALQRYARVPGHAIATFVAMRRFFRGLSNEKTPNNTKESNHGFHGYTRIEEAQALARGPRACAAFSNPSTSELSLDAENTSLSRSAVGPAEESVPPSTKDGYPRTDGAKHVPCSATKTAPDWIFVPTVLVHHLLGWWLLIKSGVVPNGARVLLFFPNLPIRLDDSGRSHWFGGPTTKLMAWLFAQLRGEVESSRVILGVETHAMRRALEGVIGMRVTYLPHPVEAAKPPRTESGGLRTDLETLNPDSLNNPPSAISYQPSAAANPLVFGCYGAARWEKGSDIFQEAIKLILKNEVASGQWPVTSDSRMVPAEVQGSGVGIAAKNLTTIEHWGRGEMEQPKVGPKGEGVGTTESKDTENTEEQFVHKQDFAWAGQAGPSESLTRSASIPAAQPDASHSLLATASSCDATPATSYPLLVTAAGRPLRFAIQWVEDFRDGEGNLVSIDPWLWEHPQVEVIGRYFEGDEYEQRLAATDVMVLPYRSPYRLRVSRVVIEAMIHGMPVIATRGTTLVEQAEEHGVVVGCDEGSAESLARAILACAEGFAEMEYAAARKSEGAAESFSVGYFRELLGKPESSLLDAKAYL